MGQNAVQRQNRVPGGLNRDDRINMIRRRIPIPGGEARQSAIPVWETGLRGCQGCLATGCSRVPPRQEQPDRGGGSASSYVVEVRIGRSGVIGGCLVYQRIDISLIAKFPLHHIQAVALGSQRHLGGAARVVIGIAVEANNGGGSKRAGERGEIGKRDASFCLRELLGDGQNVRRLAGYGRWDTAPSPLLAVLPPRQT